LQKLLIIIFIYKQIVNCELIINVVYVFQLFIKLLR
jgi:hypothetical protein